LFQFCADRPLATTYRPPIRVEVQCVRDTAVAFFLYWAISLVS
jgi:hypothetical protein